MKSTLAYILHVIKFFQKDLFCCWAEFNSYLLQNSKFCTEDPTENTIQDMCQDSML